MLDALGCGELLPLGRRFGFGERLGAGEGRDGWGQLRKGAVVGAVGWKGEEGGEEGLYAVPGESLEMFFEVCAFFFGLELGNGFV